MLRIALISENTFFQHAFSASVDMDCIDVAVQAHAVPDLTSQHAAKKLDLAVFELSKINERFLTDLVALHRARPMLKSLLILPAFSLDTLTRVFKMGCVGCLPSNIPVDAITQYLMLAAQGQRVLPDTAVDLLETLAKQAELPASAEALKSKLTSRERHVLSHLLTGEQNKQIARQLDIPLTTVKGDLKSIMRKTGAQNRTALAIAAVKTGWSEPLCRAS